MPKPTLQQTVGKLGTTQKRLISLDKKITKLQKTAIRELTDYAISKDSRDKQIRNKNWEALRLSSERKHAELNHEINSYIVQAQARSNLLCDSSTIYQSLKPHLKPFKASSTGRDARALSLLNNLKSNGWSKTDAENYVKNVEKFDFSKHLKAIDKITATQTSRISKNFVILLRLYTAHYYTWCCAKTNLNLGRTIPIGTIKTALVDLENQLAEQSREIKDIVKSESSDVSTKCLEIEKMLAKTIESKMLSFALSLYKTRPVDKEDFRDCLRLSVKAGMLIRNAILLMVSCKRLRYDFAAKTVSSGFEAWKKAASLRMTTPVTKGIKKLRPAALAANGDLYDNELVTISGRVRKVMVRHVANGKPISHVFIQEGKAVVRATLPHIKADSGGLAAGTYAEITGLWKQKHKESFNKPSLSIDRVAYAKNVNTSWTDWLTVYMNDVYQIVPHSLNLKLSWKPGTAGSINQIKYSLI